MSASHQNSFPPTREVNRLRRKGFFDIPFLSSPFLPCSGLQALLVHNLRGKAHSRGGIINVEGLELDKVNRADVTGSKAVGEEEVGGQMRQEGESKDGIRWMEDQRGSEEGMWDCVVVVGGKGRRVEVEAVRVVVSELKLVLRLMSMVVVEAKLRDWRSSAR